MAQEGTKSAHAEVGAGVLLLVVILVAPEVPVDLEELLVGLRVLGKLAPETLVRLDQLDFNAAVVRSK